MRTAVVDTARLDADVDTARCAVSRAAAFTTVAVGCQSALGLEGVGAAPSIFGGVCAQALDATEIPMIARAERFTVLMPSRVLLSCRPAPAVAEWSSSSCRM